MPFWVSTPLVTCHPWYYSSTWTGWLVVDLVFFFAFAIESSRFAPPSPWLGLTSPPGY